MSKKLGQLAMQGVKEDLFAGSQAPGAGKKFKLLPPQNFVLFNSLSIVELDSFSGISVAIAKSQLWRQGDTIISSLEIEKDRIVYSGNHDGPLPEDLSILSPSYKLIVASKSIHSAKAFESRLGEFKILPHSEDKDIYFMFLRAHGLISFDKTLKLRAEEELNWQPEADDYEGTNVAELFPFYDNFDVFEIHSESPLCGQSVFWLSYIIASNTSTLHSNYLSQQALECFTGIYDRFLWHFPIDNARIAITAPTFKHTFIDIYRCLEWLYSLPRSLKLKAELGLTQKGTVLAKSFRDQLSWRRAELDSLELLLIDADSRSLNPTDIEKCAGPLPTFPVEGTPPPEGQPKTSDEWNERVSRTLAKKIYAIRNQFVHQLDSSDIQRIDKSEEQHYINLLTKICLQIYQRYSSEF